MNVADLGADILIADPRERPSEGLMLGDQLLIEIKYLHSSPLLSKLRQSRVDWRKMPATR